MLVTVPPAIILEINDTEASDPDMTRIKVTEDCFFEVHKGTIQNEDYVVEEALKACDEKIQKKIEE